LIFFTAISCCWTWKGLQYLAEDSGTMLSWYCHEKLSFLKWQSAPLCLIATPIGFSGKACVCTCLQWWLKSQISVWEL